MRRDAELWWKLTGGRFPMRTACSFCPSMGVALLPAGKVMLMVMDYVHRL
jgi:hypothetical protein